MKSPGTVQIQPPRVSRVPAIINQCSIPVAGAVNQQKPFEELSTRRGDSKEADSLSTFRTLKKTSEYVLSLNQVELVNFIFLNRETVPQSVLGLHLSNL